MFQADLPLAFRDVAGAAIGLLVGGVVERGGRGLQGQHQVLGRLQGEAHQTHGQGARPRQGASKGDTNNTTYRMLKIPCTC